MTKLILAFIAVLAIAFTNFYNGSNDTFAKGKSSGNQSVAVSSEKSAPKQSVKTNVTKENRIYGRAVHIADGDTITFQTTAGEKFKVRLYAIDAPEKAQPYGPQSTGILRNLIGQQVLNIQIINTDRYGRKVAKIYAGKQDLNAEMIKLGAAWHYKYYDKSSDYDRYEQLEKNARAGRKGLWNRNNPTPPWEYRKAVREQQNGKAKNNG